MKRQGFVQPPVTRLPINALSLPPGHRQPSDRLIAAVRRDGVTTPLEVYPDGLIFDGSKRFLAACAAGVTAVPVMVRTS